jgi:hypothetical protein
MGLRLYERAVGDALFPPFHRKQRRTQFWAPEKKMRILVDNICNRLHNRHNRR